MNDNEWKQESMDDYPDEKAWLENKEHGGALFFSGLNMSAIVAIVMQVIFVLLAIASKNLIGTAILSTMLCTSIATWYIHKE